MTATGHAVIGTIIAAKIGDPILALPLALLSHLGADAFPHWDTATNYKTKTRKRLFIDSIADVALSFLVPILLITFLFPGTDIFYAYIVVFFALLPDWLTAPAFFFNMHYPPFTWVYKLQTIFDNRLDKPWGILTQVTVLIFLLLFAKAI